MEKNKTFRQELPIIITLGLGVMLGSMNTTMFNMALPNIMQQFNADLAQTQWLSSAYLLAMGMSAPIMAFMADRVGNKRLFLILTGSILLFSIFGCFARTIEVLIFVRFLFGFCAGLLSPLTLAMIYSKITQKYQTKAVSIWGTISICAGLLPPSVSGFLIQYFSWYALFLFNVPFAIFAWLFGNKYLCADVQPTGTTSFHTMDFTCLCIGSMCILVAVSNLSTWGVSWKFFLSILLGIALLLLYILKNKARTNAILSLQVFHYPMYVIALILDFALAIATYACTFGMPLYLQNGMGLSSATAGMVMMPQAIVCLFAMPLAGTIYETYGPKKLGIVASVTILLTSIPMTALTPNTSIWLILIALTIRSGGIMMMSMMVTNLAMSAVPTQLATHASSVKNWIQQVISSLVVACAGGFITIVLQHGTDKAICYSQGISCLLICSSIMAVISTVLIFVFVKSK